ncbi:MAG TPA: C40 family peptidase [Bacteroidota bacterium]|jgi:cell wall-associated NlpC family hydrolase|nr:C40 family peptidase [Bacteroidota bacterium]
MILLLTFAIASSAVGGQKENAKKSASVQHKKSKRKARSYKAIVYRPPVLDPTCIDTMDEVRRTMIEEINKWSSVKYKHGGMSLKGIDCSGFTCRVFKNALNYSLPRTSNMQAQIGENVPKDDLEFGDLLFFYSKVKGRHKRISHVAIYVSDGIFVHSYKRHGVGVSSLDQSYFAKHFAFARRPDPLLASEASQDE